MIEKVLIVSNPLPNRARYRLLGWLIGELKKRNMQWQLCHTQADFGASARRIQGKLAGTTLVVGLGGDGTLHLLANCLAGSDIPLAILPCGTGNDFIRSLGYTLTQWKSAVFNPEARKVDLGKVNERFFINIAGVGFDAAVVKETMSTKSALAKFSYMFSGAKKLGTFKGEYLQLEVNGRYYEFDNLMTVFANGRFFGGGLQAAPDANLHDGELDCYRIQAGAFVYRLYCFFQMLFGRHTRLKEVAHQRVRRARILTPGLDIEADGELIGSTPADISVVADALVLRCPEK